jgi:hypothetical protein
VARDVPEGGGDGGVAGQAQDADDEVAEGGHDVWPGAGAVEACWPKMASRT